MLLLDLPGKLYKHRYNRPRSIYQYSNMATRLSGQTSIFGVIFFVFKSLLGIERQKKLRKFTFFTRKPRSHVRILIYRMLPISFFLDRFLLAFPNVRRSSNFKIYFLAQNNKNRKYDNALAPTDFVTKEGA